MFCAPSISFNDLENIKPDEEDGDTHRVVTIASPLNGLVRKLEEAPDEVFSRKMLGDGVIIEPTEGTVYAPENGTVTMLFDTKHAVGYKTDSGVELLIHVGIDTVKLNGEGFQVAVKVGEHLKKGDVIMNFDMEKIRGAAAAMSTPIICTELSDGQKITVLRYGEVQVGEALMTIE